MAKNARKIRVWTIRANLAAIRTEYAMFWMKRAIHAAALQVILGISRMENANEKTHHFSYFSDVFHRFVR